MTEGEVAEPQDRRSRWMWVTLAAILLAAGGFHGFSYLERKPKLTPSAATNAPAGAVATARPGAMKVITTLPGQAVELAEIEKLKVA